MSKELEIITVNVEFLIGEIEQPLTELNELNLSLIGGGGAIVTF